MRHPQPLLQRGQQGGQSLLLLQRQRLGGGITLDLLLLSAACARDATALSRPSGCCGGCCCRGCSRATRWLHLFCPLLLLLLLLFLADRRRTSRSRGVMLSQLDLGRLLRLLGCTHRTGRRSCTCLCCVTTRTNSQVTPTSIRLALVARLWVNTGALRFNRRLLTACTRLLWR